MSPAENIERLIKKFCSIKKSSAKTSAELDKKIVDDAVAKLCGSADRQINFWRILMESKITKLAIAAVIIIAVLAGINYFVGSIGVATPAFADIVRPFLSARTATFKATMKVEGAPTRTLEGMFMEPVHMRWTSAEGVTVISDLQQGKIITLVPAQKQAMVIEMQNIPEDKDQSQFNFFHEVRRRILEAQETEDESVEFLGEQEINGVLAIGYHVRKPGAEISIWANKETKMPIRLEISNGPVTNTMSNIVFDVELDESLFDLKVPEGYTIRKMQVDASEPTEEDLLEMFRIWAEHMDGNLPSVLDMNASMEFVKYQQKKMKEEDQELSEQEMMDRMLGIQQTIMKMSRGGMFVQQLPADSDWHYAGGGVKLGEASKAIFWYRPKDSQTYRVIYGDLHVEDVTQENLPE
jgi:outer membrane lipoprotein-sorting protein